MMEYYISSNTILYIPLFLFFYLFINPVSSLKSGNQVPSILELDKDNKIQTYIVHLARPEGTTHGFLGSDEELEKWHKSFLPNSTLDSGEPRLIYSYSEVMTGFAARLTAHEVEAMRHMDGFLHAKPDVQHELETTYTPQFLGLSQTNGTWEKYSNMGEGITIGVIDSGIPRHHPSFGDDMMPAKKPNWNGTCNFSNFTCNNKIIGAVMFDSGKKTTPPVDTGGHGSHVASIAAGNFVNDALDLGKFKYKASGMAPRAHLAIYKVCPPCNGSDIRAAFQQAIRDGVNIINLSLGASPTDDFYNDTGASGSYPAIEKGISVSVSAGNRGRTSGLSHSAPWLMVVGMTSTDRRLAATVKLGNGKEFVGETVYQPSWFNSSVLQPLAFPGINNTIETLYCKNGSMDNIDVKGKIVLCWSAGNGVFEGRVVKEAGGAAMILVGPGGNTPQVRHVLPVSYVKYADGNYIKQYYRSSLSAGSTSKATIVFQGQVPGLRPSPGIDTMSSRGPSLTNGGILKPDVVAPGRDILGAWPYRGGPSDNYFRFNTGTSMASPHVAGTMALIKKKHPTWSPAAIQSAIITTAKDMDLDGKPMVDNKNGKPASIFAKGAGLVNPSGAMDPGLVYDRNFSDYKGYMCGLGYNSRTVGLIIDQHVNCTKVKKIKASQLNYASIMVTLSNISPNETVRRTVTNVGDANSEYKARVVRAEGANITISLINFNSQSIISR